MSEWMVTTSSAVVLDESILQLWLLGHNGNTITTADSFLLFHSTQALSTQKNAINNTASSHCLHSFPPFFFFDFVRVSHKKLRYRTKQVHSFTLKLTRINFFSLSPS
jgi:hypothetical protein